MGESEKSKKKKKLLQTNRSGRTEPSFSVCCLTPSNVVARLPSSSPIGINLAIASSTHCDVRHTDLPYRPPFQNGQEGERHRRLSSQTQSRLPFPVISTFDPNPSTCRSTPCLVLFWGGVFSSAVRVLAGVAQPPERKSSTELRARCWYVISALCMPRCWVCIGSRVWICCLPVALFHICHRRVGPRDLRRACLVDASAWLIR